jgi:hypothetical protein
MNNQNVTRGGCLRTDDPKWLWTSTVALTTAERYGRLLGFRTHLTMRAPR